MIIAKHGDKVELMFEVEEMRKLLKLVILGSANTQDDELLKFGDVLNRGSKNLMDRMEGR